jgi:hypothetical protein
MLKRLDADILYEQIGLILWLRACKMIEFKKKTFRDATTGKKVEVVAGKNGKLFHIEAFSYSFIKSTQKAAHSHNPKRNLGQKT